MVIGIIWKKKLQNNWNDVAEEFGLIDMYRGLYKLADIGETGSQLGKDVRASAVSGN